MRTLRRAVPILLLLLAPAAARAQQQDLYYTLQIPDDPGTGVFQLPWEVHEHDGTSFSTSPIFSIPGATPISAVHRMDASGHWLVSLALPSPGPLPPGFVEARDVLRYDGAGGYSMFFCGAGVTPSLPANANVDAVFLDGGDDGDLVLSVDLPIPLDPVTFALPGDLLRYARTGPGCAGWSFVGKAFDSAAAGGGVPSSTNLIGAAPHGGEIFFVVDIPTTLTPSASPPDIYEPREIISWDGASFARVYAPGTDPFVAAFPPSNSLTAISTTGNPGRIDLSAGLLTVFPSASPGDVDLAWPGSCSAGASDYAVYEGAVGSWYSHGAKACSTGGATSTTITPSPGNRYFLVVPLSGDIEGSYGVDSTGAERPPAPPVCASTQALISCP